MVKNSVSLYFQKVYIYVLSNLGVAKNKEHFNKKLLGCELNA